MARQSDVPILMTVAAALLWASSFSVVKVGLRHIEPYPFVFLRFLVASGVLLVIVLLSGQAATLAAYVRDRYVLLLGLTLAGSFGLQFRGQTETTAAKAAMIINSGVVLVAPLSVVLLKEYVGLRKLIALAIGVCGVYFVVSGRSMAPDGIQSLRGDLLITGSSLCYALYIVFTKMAVSRRRFREIPLITGVFLWTLPVFALGAVPAFGGGLKPDTSVWLSVGYLAVFCSVLPFVIWTAAIKHIGALTSAIVLLAELVFGVIIACTFLGETLSGAVIAGCVLISAGILMVGR
jgi:drug/metabolite transporter (DMT)-like permease